MRTLIIAICLLGTSALATAAPLTVPITACGDAVPRRATGYLTGDLDCTGFDGIAVLVSRLATLELRGFTITGGHWGIGCAELRPREDLPPALYSSGRCTIVGGGGRITGAESLGIFGDRPIVSALTIDGCGQEGISARIDGYMSGVTVSGNGGIGIRVDRNALVDGASITGNGGDGILARKVRLSNTTVTGNGIGSECGAYPLRPCADVSTAKRPRLENSSCDTSRVLGAHPVQSWGVCALDPLN